MAKSPDDSLTGETDMGKKNQTVNATLSPPAPTNLVTFASTGPNAAGSASVNRVATLNPGDLKEFNQQSVPVQNLLSSALSLTQRSLSYKYGSDNPQNGGMDCSGTIYYLLKQAGLKDVPRDSSELYRWIWKSDTFRAVVSEKADTFELSKLKPGDLLFWTGTYQIDRDPPVTHVMIYLGTQKQNGRRIMMGASEGRTYDGRSRYGVSVFDFKIPVHHVTSGETGGEGRFIGYGTIPGLESIPSAPGDSPASQPAASKL